MPRAVQTTGAPLQVIMSDMHVYLQITNMARVIQSRVARSLTSMVAVLIS